MNIITTPNKLDSIKVEKISRRSVLKGLGIAAGFVLAVPVTSRRAMAAYTTGAAAMPHGTVVDPRVFVAIASDGTTLPPADAVEPEGLVRKVPAEVGGL